MKFRALTLAGVLAGLCAVPASAHHSYAMFDREKQTEITGTVKEFKWTNPHSWLTLEVVNAQGGMDDYTLEMGGPGGLAQRGWRPKTVVPGDKVIAIMHPLKDGSHGGQFVSVTLADGRKLGDQSGGGGGGGGGGGAE